MIFCVSCSFSLADWKKICQHIDFLINEIRREQKSWDTKHYQLFYPAWRWWNVEEWRHNLKISFARAFSSLHEEKNVQTHLPERLKCRKVLVALNVSPMLDGLKIELILEGTVLQVKSELITTYFQSLYIESGSLARLPLKSHKLPFFLPLRITNCNFYNN